MLLAGMTTAGGVAAGTLGFWTFEGAPGNVIAAETTFANKIDGTTLLLRSVDRYGNAESAGRLSTFVAPCEASSQMYIKPARVGEETPFASAYRIAGSGANGGCPLWTIRSARSIFRPSRSKCWCGFPGIRQAGR